MSNYKSLLAVSALSGCKDPDVLTIGAVLQLSGSLADTGAIYRHAYELAVDRVNEKGGVSLGDLRYKLIALDEASTQVEVTIAYRLTGMLAQFGRAGIVQDLAARLTAAFAQNVEARLSGAAPPAPLRHAGETRSPHRVLQAANDSPCRTASIERRHRPGRSRSSCRWPAWPRRP